MKETAKKRFAIGAVSALVIAVILLCVGLSMPVPLSPGSESDIETADSPDLLGGNPGVVYEIETTADHIDLEKELAPSINEIIEQAQEQSGGKWSVYISVPSTGDKLLINGEKMQAASVIKLFTMGAVYEDYDKLAEDYGKEEIERLTEAMITVSDNEAADMLIVMLGHGDASLGKERINKFCKAHGMNDTTVERMMADDNVYIDNYSSTRDAGRFLEMVLDCSLPHSDEMLKILKAQQRRNKIPAGVPSGIKTAGKTGELEDVENDAAIVFTSNPYIICVFSDGVTDYQPPIDAIVEISREAYGYLAPRLAE